MTGINSIRNTFSKGSIVIGDKSVSVIYADQDWVTQSIDGKHKTVLSGLLESSERFTIRIKKGNSIKLGFISGMDSQKVIYYSPLEKEISKEKIEELIKSMEPSKEFIEFFDGVNMQDEDVVLDKMSEWVNKVSEKWKRKVRNIDKLRGWPIIKEKALKFANANGCQTEILDPNDIFDGSINIQIPEVFTRSLVFVDKNKNDLIELVDLCEEVGMEMNPKEGYLNIILFP